MAADEPVKSGLISHNWFSTIMLIMFRIILIASSLCDKNVQEILCQFVFSLAWRKYSKTTYIITLE